MERQALLSSLLDNELSAEQVAALASEQCFEEDFLQKLEAYQMVRDALAGDLPNRRLKGLRQAIIERIE